MEYIKWLFGWGKPTMSYHITKDFGGGVYLFWWPISGFNQFCTDEAEAQAEFERITKEDVECGYRLVRYKAVVQYGDVCGITGTHELLVDSKT